MHVAIVSEPHLVTREESDPPSTPAHRGEGSFWGQAAPNRDPADHAWQLARDGFEDIGTLRRIRLPRGRETWNQPFREERRLFAQLDAVLAGGSAVLRRASDSVLQQTDVPPDPEWIFAVALAIGCDSSPESKDALFRIFRHCCTLGPLPAEAVVEALSLIPARALPESFRDLLSQNSGLECAYAAQVLSRRGELDALTVSSLLSNSEPITLVAAIEAALEQGSASALSRVPEFFGHPDRVVARTALLVGFAANLTGARQRALQWCDDSPDFGDAFICLGLFGNQADGEVFRRGCGLNRAAALRASAYWGFVRMVPLLLEIIQSEEPDRFLAAESFERLTGAGLYLRPDWDENAEIDPVAFETWWKQRGSIFSPNTRYRRGMALSPKSLVAELTDLPMDPADRLLVHLELTALSSPPPPRFRPWDFIASQRASIRKWRERFALPEESNARTGVL